MDKKYFVVKNYLTDDECDDYLTLCRVLDPNPTLEVGLKKESNKNKHVAVNRTYWTIRSMTKHMRPLKALAEEKFGLEPDSLKFKFGRFAHIMCYDTPGQGLEWHAEPNISKVSVSINLSDEWEYVGADFEMKMAPNLDLKKGDAILYSGSAMHRVSDLIGGRKFSFVMWLA